MTGKIAEFLGNRLNDVVINFHAHNRLLVESQSGQDISSPSGADNQNGCVGSQVVGQIGNVILYKAEFCRIPIKPCQDRKGASVDVQVKLLDFLITVVIWAKARSGREFKSTGITKHSDIRKGIPPFIEGATFLALA